MKHHPIYVSLKMILLCGLFVGCESQRDIVSTPSTAPVTQIDPARAEPDFWLNQPANHRTAVAGFDTLWDAADEVSRDLLFKIDRRDRRAGILTTAATVSAQWYEPWRQELQQFDDVADSSVATIRRTIRYEFARQGDAYVITPKVLVERQAIVERRISGALPRTYFRRDRDLNTFGSRETDAGVTLPDSYWYPIGRDELLEARLVEKINAAIR